MQSTTLEVQHLSKAYRKGKSVHQAVDDVSFSAAPGEIVGILGPNGSGKTTTLKAIAGLTSMDTGDIYIRGQNQRQHHLENLFALGAVLEGARNVYWRMSTLENILYFAGLKGIPRTLAKSRAETFITALELEDYRNKEVRSLSKGNQQKVAIACAMIHEPALTLLDEPTLGLDVAIVNTMKHWLKTLSQQNGACMLITSHDLDFIEAVCDRVLILFKGKVISEDSVSGLRARYSPRKQLDLLVRGDVALQVRQELANLSDCEFSIQDSDTRVIMHCSDLDVLTPGLGLLASAGNSLLDIHVSEESLEDIFLNVIAHRTTL